MIRSNPRLSWLPTLWQSCLFLPFVAGGCASGSAHMNVGSSERGGEESADDALSDEDELADDEALTDEAPTNDDDPPESPASAQADGQGSEVDPYELERKLEEEREAEQAALARAALHAAPSAENHFGLVMAVSERTSDLPWILAIENRSTKPVRLAALPALLRAEVTPPPPPPTEGDVTPAPSSSPVTAKAPEPKLCGAKSLPSSVSPAESVELLPGQLLFHAFDPRDLCEGEDALREGAVVEMSYGFPLQTKKLWRGGKLTTVEIAQTAPFVAERPPEGEEVFVPLKFLKAEPIRLDQTYPLSSVSALPQEEEDATTETDTEDEAPPPPPLELKVFPLGTSESPEDGVVTVQLRNTSGKSMTLFVRRELFTYQVSGPLGEATCQMHPTERAPDAAAFSTLSPGGTISLSTRLAEACPPGTWDLPGTYSVSALFQATADGTEHDIEAFMGSAVTKSAARLIVPGKDGEGERPMKIAPSRIDAD
jgi:hypothetical protein